MRSFKTIYILLFFKYFIIIKDRNKFSGNTNMDQNEYALNRIVHRVIHRLVHGRKNLPKGLQYTAFASICTTGYRIPLLERTR